MPGPLNLPSMNSSGEAGQRKGERERKFRHACTQDSLAKAKMKRQVEIYISWQVEALAVRGRG